LVSHALLHGVYTPGKKKTRNPGGVLPLGDTGKAMFRKGDRFEAMSDVRATCLLIHAAPFTDGFETTIPRGTILVVSHDLVDGATSVACQPEEYRRFEKLLVPWRMRARFWSYREYQLIIDVAEFGVSLGNLGRLD
jgi:hypothetical protein